MFCIIRSCFAVTQFEHSLRAAISVLLCALAVQAQERRGTRAQLIVALFLDSPAP